MWTEKIRILTLWFVLYSCVTKFGYKSYIELEAKADSKMLFSLKTVLDSPESRCDTGWASDTRIYDHAGLLVPN
jgi:hypothetical protein